MNFTNIANAIKAIEAVRGKDEYKRFKVNFGKDRCGNPPRQMNPQQQQQGQENGVQSPSPMSSMQASRAQHSISPGSGTSQNGQYNLQGPTPSSILNSGNANPLTLYLAAAQAQAQMPQQQPDMSPSAFEDQQYFQSSQQQQGQQQQSQHIPTTSAAQAFYSSPNEVTSTRTSGLDISSQSQFGHGNHQSINITNGMPMNAAYANPNSPASRGSHNRAVSLPAFNLQQAQAAQQQQAGFAGLGAGLGGFGASSYAMNGEGAMPGWPEEEVA